MEWNCDIAHIISTQLIYAEDRRHHAVYHPICNFSPWIMIERCIIYPKSSFKIMILCFCFVFIGKWEGQSRQEKKSYKRTSCCSNWLWASVSHSSSPGSTKQIYVRSFFLPYIDLLHLQSKMRIGLAEKTVLVALGQAAVYSDACPAPPVKIQSPLEEVGCSLAILSIHELHFISVVIQ